MRSHHFLAPSTSQESAYSALARPCLEKLGLGYSVSLVAYGQTGSGKTHTMFGPPGSLRSDSAAEWGLMPRLLSDLLDTPNVTLSASAVEVYQDLAYDLLSDSCPLTVGSKGRGQQTGVRNNVAVAGPISGTLGAVGGAHPAGCYCCYCERAKMKKQEDFRRMMAERRGEPPPFDIKGTDPMKAKRKSKSSPNMARRESKGAGGGGYATVGEKIMPLRNLDDVLELCRTVELSRTSASHDLNERSSRSHCLVSVHVVTGGGGRTTRTKCLLVDLAGSERIAKSKVEGVAKAQAIEINKSLTALGRIIKSLANGATHVPYRDSTLTMLLKDSFTGRASTTFVVCVSDASEHDEETTRSLQFGERLGGVRTKLVRAEAVANTELSGGKAELEELLARMRGQLENLDAGGVDETATNPAAVRKFHADCKRLQTLKGKIKALEEEAYIAGKGRSATSAELKELRDSARRLSEDVERVKGAVDRLTKRPFWREPSSAWKRKMEEIKTLEGRLQVMMT